MFCLKGFHVSTWKLCYAGGMLSATPKRATNERASSFLKCCKNSRPTCINRARAPTKQRSLVACRSDRGKHAVSPARTANEPGVDDLWGMCCFPSSRCFIFPRLAHPHDSPKLHICQYVMAINFPFSLTCSKNSNALTWGVKSYWSAFIDTQARANLYFSRTSNGAILVLFWFDKTVCFRFLEMGFSSPVLCFSNPALCLANSLNLALVGNLPWKSRREQEIQYFTEKWTDSSSIMF